MTFYVTKYALTKGILEVEASDPADSEFPDMLIVRRSPVAGDAKYYHGEGRDWHRTKLAAVDRANSMVCAKLKSLKAQMTKLSLMRFE